MFGGFYDPAFPISLKPPNKRVTFQQELCLNTKKNGIFGVYDWVT